MALTASRVDKFGLSFSPDGRSVAFSANQGGRWNHYLISIGRERMIFDLAESTGNIWTAEWTKGW